MGRRVTACNFRSPSQPILYVVHHSILQAFSYAAFRFFSRICKVFDCSKSMRASPQISFVGNKQNCLYSMHCDYLILTTQNGVVNGVATLSFSIGYSGLDSVESYGESKNRSVVGCNIKNSRIINKAGFLTDPSVSSAQAAVRSGANVLLQSACPGFGLCGDLVDGDDQDVWPITAITVRRTSMHTKFAEVEE